MSENFKKKEQLIFGTDGFDLMLEKVAIIEKKLGIFELLASLPFYNKTDWIIDTATTNDLSDKNK